jgi:hypothetical protein
MRDACVLICCFFHLAGKISTHGIFRHADITTLRGSSPDFLARKKSLRTRISTTTSQPFN